ncbi:MAG: bifunctional riboflavin kinase/FAD synthetase [Gemmatimonas sp.]|nr:bifunctional riboflavin kinase/FAD synthetase [Gemmatimonas sp.]
MECRGHGRDGIPRRTARRHRREHRRAAPAEKGVRLTGVPRSVPPLPLQDRGAVVTIGTFDGVHRGHRAVLDEIARRAQRTGRRSVLVTFHPHPLHIVRPEIAPRLLTSPAEKKEFLAESGLQYAVFLAFTPDLQQYSARRFVEDILIARLGMKELVIGYDHGFGRGREGNVDTMQELGQELGFEVDAVGEVRVGDEPISSSAIREALERGDVVSAAHALGRPYSVQGPVVQGMHRGQKLGFPTANLSIGDPEKLVPLEGIYAVHGVVDGQHLPGLLHLGPRPTFSGFPPSVELHLLDWKGDLYGRVIRVDFCARLREVRPFSSPEELIDQMHRDAELGRRILAGDTGDGANACGEATK